MWPMRVQKGETSVKDSQKNSDSSEAPMRNPVMKKLSRLMIFVLGLEDYVKS